jgi:hypothetical protein
VTDSLRYDSGRSTCHDDVWRHGGDGVVHSLRYDGKASLTNQSTVKSSGDGGGTDGNVVGSGDSATDGADTVSVLATADGVRRIAPFLHSLDSEKTKRWVDHSCCAVRSCVGACRAPLGCLRALLLLARLLARLAHTGTAAEVGLR